ncbi:hypothetical protein LP092_07290 [Moraxella bovis]|uniref:Uncharacterized protein n=1 Tax=Moraxella bovis TaxID=476 RepID=A0ABY6MBX5_MORBO|nr:hypothetical protein [Moraxella bovis]UZA04519.1 hypothetical protein LP092_07290 [Moraxella bovis]
MPNKKAPVGNGETATYQPFTHLMHKDGLGLAFVLSMVGVPIAPSDCFSQRCISVGGQSTGVKKAPPVGRAKKN